MDIIFIKDVEPYISKKGIKKSKALYKCFCGNEFECIKRHIISGNTKSCGCYRKEKLKERKITHGLTNHILFTYYTNMIYRCYNPNHISYKHYGGKGITVCKEWLNKENGLTNFINDMYPSFKKNHTLERIKSSKNYSKENCKWASWDEQSRNKENTNLITYKGITQCAKDWSLSLGGCKNLVQERLHKGWNEQDAVSTPLLRKRKK